MPKKSRDQGVTPDSHNDQNQNMSTLTPQEAIGSAVSFMQRQDFVSAEIVLNKILAVQPENPDSRHLLAIIRCEQSRLDEAEALLSPLCTEYPEHSAYQNTWGRLCWLLGRHEEAKNAWQTVRAHSPQTPEPWLNQAEAEVSAGDLGAAIASFQAALRLCPIFPKASIGLAQAVVMKDGWAAAIPYYQMAVAQDPDNPNIRYRLSQALVAAGHAKLALPILDEIVTRWPQHWGAWIDLSALREQANDYSGALIAIQNAQRALVSTNDPAREMITLAHHVQLQRATADWSGLEAGEHALVEYARQCMSAGRPYIGGSRPFQTLYLPYSPQEQLYIAKHFSQGFVPQGVQPCWTQERIQRQGRLRIGYLIADVCNHPNAHNTLLLYELHDPSLVEVFVYSWGEDLPQEEHSYYRNRIMGSAEHFIEMKGWSDVAMADRIAMDGIQVLVDLMGYTTHHRATVLARRPAPIQVNYLGYPGTSGAEYIDYILGDSWVTPESHADNFSEKIFSLTNTYQINSHRDVPLEAAFPRAQLNLPEDSFVYCCFNSNYKITPTIFSIWMEILHAVPNSVLWLLKSNEETETHLKKYAEDQGIDSQRLIFAPFWRRNAHLRRLQAADLFLDTAPYSAHTTASDALWAGVPVLTVPGDTFASRVAASLLQAARLEECILTDWERYKDQAIALALDQKDTLARWKTHLRHNTQDLPIFDTPALVRELESAYEQMWQEFSVSL